MFAKQDKRGTLRKVGKFCARFSCICVLFFHWMISANADSLSQWLHEQWQADRGLPQNSVLCLAQDHHGFLWFGTENGLVRFDGIEFKVFNEQKTPAIPHNFVTSLLVARDGSLWVGTRTGGLARYLDGRFDLMAIDDVCALAQSSDDAIWIGTPHGLKCLHDGTSSTFTIGLPD